MNTIIEQTKWRVSKARDMKWGEPYIPCKYGLIRQYDDGDLDVWVTSIRMAARLEKQWPVKKQYDDGAFFVRPFTDLDEVCRVLKARRKRILANETLIKMRDRGRKLAEQARIARLARSAS